MSPKLLAAVLGGLGGLLLALAGGLSFLARSSPEWHRVLADVGYAAVVAGLCVMGYAIVARAPVWLRLIVSVALPLLAASVWQVVDQVIHDRVDGWKASATTHLLGGVLLLVLALVVARRSAANRPDAYAPTHHR